MLKTLTKYDYREMLCDALRSGKYKRIRGCCGAGEKTMWGKTQACALYVGVFEGLWPTVDLGDGSIAPSYSEVNKKLGMNSADIFIKNDEGWTFKQIAKWIEEQP